MINIDNSKNSTKSSTKHGNSKKFHILQDVLQNVLLFHQKFISRKFFRLLEKHNSIRLPFSPYSSFLPQIFQNIGEFGPSSSSYNSVICCYKRKFFWSILLNKSQQRGIFKRLLDSIVTCLFASY